MNKAEIPAFNNKTFKAIEYIFSLSEKRAHIREVISDELKALGNKCRDIYAASREEQRAGVYGNTLTYRDEILALVAEATKIYHHNVDKN